jgi:hypothetical protein
MDRITPLSRPGCPQQFTHRQPHRYRHRGGGVHTSPHGITTEESRDAVVHHAHGLDLSNAHVVTAAALRKRGVRDPCTSSRSHAACNNEHGAMEQLSNCCQVVLHRLVSLRTACSSGWGTAFPREHLGTVPAYRDAVDAELTLRSRHHVLFPDLDAALSVGKDVKYGPHCNHSCPLERLLTCSR